MLLGCFEPIGRAKKTALGLKSKISSNLHFGRVLKTGMPTAANSFRLQ
jgi:hypothetical protein